jgi:hypothetical protein
MLTIDLIGSTWPIQISSKYKVDKLLKYKVDKLLKIKVIKSQDKEIKLKDHAPRHMRSKS